MILDHQEIMKLLPHRYPFLMVDRITEIVEGEKIVGIKNVTLNEPYFQGHFPGHPIMPGVMILEAMAQVGGIYALKVGGVGENKVTYFVGIDKARFRKPVFPGDTLRMDLALVGCRRGIWIFHGKSYVGDKMVADAELKATFIDQ